MAVTQDLLNKIADYEKQGYTSDDIVKGLQQSQNYKDVSSKIKFYQAKDYSSDEILKGIKASPVAQVEPQAETKPKTYMQRLLHPEKRGAANYPDEPISTKESLQKASPFVRNTLELGGLTAGSVAATPGNVVAPGVANVVGAGLGYAAGKSLADMYDEAIGLKEPETSPAKVAIDTGKNVLTGSAMEAGGAAGMKILAETAKPIGNALKSAWGRITGTGKGAIEEAIKSGTETGLSGNPISSKTAFDKALRGEITGDEVVANAKSALEGLMEQRASAYQSQLRELAETENITVNVDALKQEAHDLLKKYVRVGKDGKPDWSRSALGQKDSEGVKKIRSIMKTIDEWGSKEGDATPLGLDMLKRQLDDFYAETSNARSFVSSLRNKVKDALVKEVPQYAEMTKDYADATELIKDIESGLMIKKNGKLVGRIVADQTLRRLMSSMRENFALRKDLVDILSNKSGEDLGGQIAGYTMRSPIPIGLSGTGPALIGESLLIKIVSPKLWPILAASSPRLSAEFLRMYGKFAAEASGMGAQVGRTAAYEASKFGR